LVGWLVGGYKAFPSKRLTHRHTTRLNFFGLAMSPSSDCAMGNTTAWMRKRKAMVDDACGSSVMSKFLTFSRLQEHDQLRRKKRADLLYLGVDDFKP
jgi:hypothetical protein